MWTILPSTSTKPKSEFFNTDALDQLARDLSLNAPVIKGKVWAGEDRSHGWTIECESFESFAKALKTMPQNVKFLAIDESHVDEDALRVVQDELYNFAEDERVSNEMINKAISALRSHDGELFAVFAYAFLASGQVLFVRAQTELAQYIFHPDRLLSSDALSSVRKLKTLVEN